MTRPGIASAAKAMANAANDEMTELERALAAGADRYSGKSLGRCA